MTCAERMRADYPKCVPHQRLLDALEMMGEDNVGWVAVVESHDNPTFLGWITAQRAAVYLGMLDRRPSEVMCRELMEAPAAVLRPEQELGEARAMIARAQVRRLPVVKAGKLVGVLGLD